MKRILNLVVLLLILLTIASLMMALDCKSTPEPPNLEKITLLSPAFGATVPLTVEFTWELENDSGENFYEYDVYLDDHTPPTTMVATHLSMPSHFQTLLPNTHYTWKVVGTDYNNGKSLESVEWQFFTGE